LKDKNPVLLSFSDTASFRNATDILQVQKHTVILYSLFAVNAKLDPLSQKHTEDPCDRRIGYNSISVADNSEILVPKGILGIGQFNDLIQICCDQRLLRVLPW